MIGYDVITGSFDAKTNTVKFDVAIALEGGLLYGRSAVTGDAKTFEGKMSGGTRGYKGVSGALQVVQKSENKSVVTVDLD